MTSKWMLIGVFLLAFSYYVTATSLQRLPKDKLKEFIEQNNVSVVGYNFIECKYSTGFLIELEEAADILAEGGISVAYVNESVAEWNTMIDTLPTVFLLRKGVPEFPITWAVTGKEIATVVTRKVDIPPVQELTDPDLYPIYVQKFGTVVTAFLRTQEELEIYKQAADQFYHAFLFTFNDTIANKTMKTVNPAVTIQYGLPANLTHYYHKTPSNVNELRTWISEHIWPAVSPLSIETVHRAFGDRGQDFIIVFFPHTWSANYTEKIKELRENSLILYKKARIFYVDSDNYANKPLLTYFGITDHRETTIVHARNLNCVEAMPLTKKCAKPDPNCVKEIKYYKDYAEMYGFASKIYWPTNGK